MTIKKKKLLCWCDFLVDTGFGIVAKNLLDTMYEDYEVSVLGINYHGLTKYDTSKYFVYPIAQPDILGLKRLPDIIKKEQPDLLFLFQDIFHISDLLPKIKKELPEHAKIAAYFPIDGSPVSLAWKNVIEEVDLIITYTDWAIEQIRNRFPEFKDKTIYKLYHGVDPEVFYPHSEGKIKDLRKQWGWKDKFVVSNVNRFQPRKAIPLGIRAFSMFAKGYKVCKCGNWMPINRNKCDLNMCSSEDIIETVERNRTDVFLYLHMMAKEYSMGPGRANILQSHLINAGFSDEDIGSILGVNARNIYKGEVPESVINDIYNASNINFSTTLGEGVGLSLIESASCGTPSIVPKNSATPEMLRNTGHLIPNEALFNMAMDNAHLRPIADVREVVKALDVEYDKWVKSGKEKIINQDCIDNVNTNFRWPDKIYDLKKWFKELLEKK